MSSDCTGCKFLKGFGYCIYKEECVSLDCWEPRDSGPCKDPDCDILSKDYEPIQEITVRRKDYKKDSRGEKESLNEAELVAKDIDTIPFRDDSKLPDPYIILQKEAFDDSDELPFEDLKVYTEKDRYIDGHGQVMGKDGGLKNDKDKPDWSLIPLDIIEGIVEVLTYGAKKYERDNWKKVSVNRNFAALLRHLTKWQAGEDYDQESGLHHLDHALCDLMFIRWKIVARKEVD